ncbi:putative membrane protein [Thiorhodovibrio winogradskyi]|uniref:Membrane protein n=1 Tax=Thiorhodovibrio winogradskyi TaxID=77007 RepID=A0ABZ0S6H3_9GAMM|nr:glycosyl transferase family 39 [Thiorhodovibrio winogradskyi]
MRNAPRLAVPRQPVSARRHKAATLAAILPWLLAGLILALSLWRLVGLDHLLVWHDEVFTLIRVLGQTALEVNQRLFSATLLSPAQVLAFQQGSANTWTATLTALMRHPEHPPLYYLLARALMALPLDPVIAMRGVSAGFGMLLPLAAFWLMQEVFGAGKGERAWLRPLVWPAPWLAALLVAASPLHLLYAQEGRQYALWTLLVVVASATLMRALRTRQQLAWIGYAAALSLALYTHLLSLLLIPLHAFYGLLASTRETGWKIDWKAGWKWGWRQARQPLVQRFALAVGVALLLFSPWLVLMVVAADQVNQFTSWMQRPITLEQILLAWRDHLTRVFIDIRTMTTGSGVPTWTALMLLPVALALGHYLYRAPRPAAWFLPLLALVFIGVVLGPDLLLGGSRSLHPRYALPSLLALQLMLAWSLGQALTGASTLWRAGAGIALASLLGAGLWSFTVIHHAETWWNKNFSAGNRAVAQRINQAPAPLVLVSPSSVGTGELLSLAYHLAPQVRIWGELQTGDGADTGTGASRLLPDGFASYFALTPSTNLKTAVQPLGLKPLPGHWQWFQALPSSAMPGETRNLTPEQGSRSQE